MGRGRHLRAHKHCLAHTRAWPLLTHVHTQHHDSSYSPEEKKDDSAPAPFLDISDQSRTKVELDRRLIYGLNDPAPSSVSPDRSLLSPSVEEIPHTRTQLLHHYKKKHEFSSMLSQHVPSDVTAASNISKAQRGRSRNKKRRDRSNSNSPEQRNISGSLSPTRRVNYDQVSSSRRLSRIASRPRAGRFVRGVEQNEQD